MQFSAENVKQLDVQYKNREEISHFEYYDRAAVTFVDFHQYRATEDLCMTTLPFLNCAPLFQLVAIRFLSSPIKALREASRVLAHAAASVATVVTGKGRFLPLLPTSLAVGARGVHRAIQEQHL